MSIAQGPVPEKLTVDVQALLKQLWDSALPLALRDAAGRLTDMNAAYQALPTRVVDAVGGPLTAAPGNAPLRLIRQVGRNAQGESVLLDMLVPLPVAHDASKAAPTETWRAPVEAPEALDVTRASPEPTPTLPADMQRLLRERDLMLNLSEVGMAWLQSGKVVRSNQALAELTGWAASELIGIELASHFESPPGTLIAQATSGAVAPAAVPEPGQGLAAAAQGGLTDGAVPDVGLSFASAASRALSSRGRYTGLHRLRRRDGQLRWVQVTLRVVDPEQPSSAVVCSVVDVDERQRARESLQSLAGRTRAVLDSVLVGIVTLGERGIEWMNGSARRMFAGDLADFAGESLALVATPEASHPLRRSDWFERLANGQSETFECRLRARDGREFWVVGNAVATVRDSAVGRQVTFALLDIETRRQAEVRVSNARASLQRIIETAPLAIALFDAGDYRVAQMNQMAAQFFGRAAEELLGRVALDCFSDAGEAAAFAASLALAREAPEGVRRELTRESGLHAGRPGAAPRRWDARFVQVSQGADGDASNAGQVMLVASDVTEQRVAEQARFDAAIAQRDMLVREVHHRIKNNLQGVAGLLQQTALRRPEVQAVLTDAVSQVQAIAQVYGLQVGGAAGPLDLHGVVAAIAQSVQRTFGATITVAPPAQGPVWRLPEGEAIPIALTLNELMTNAVKHGAGVAKGAVGGVGGVGVGDGNGMDAGRAPMEPVLCQVLAGEAEAVIEISNFGQLVRAIDVGQLPSSMQGLGLVRALLPRRAARLKLLQENERVVARLSLLPPSIRRTEPAPAQEPAAAVAAVAAAGTAAVPVRPAAEALGPKS